MSFETAINNTPLLREHLERGLQALGKNSSKVKSKDTQKCEGSVDIDRALALIYSQENRWDYAVGYDGTTHFIEVHPADTSEITTMEEKRRWLKDFLRDKAPELNEEPKRFHWVATAGVNISKNSTYQRRLALLGIGGKIHKQLIL
ncbi:MAG: hypothetical protein VKJ02_11365 [Snowella sp.]|nr:hypothetical protein [Snowella sp.]